MYLDVSVTSVTFFRRDEKMQMCNGAVIHLHFSIIAEEGNSCGRNVQVHICILASITFLILIKIFKITFDFMIISFTTSLFARLKNLVSKIRVQKCGHEMLKLIL